MPTTQGAFLILFEDEPWEDAMVEIIEILRQRRLTTDTLRTAQTSTSTASPTLAA
jgi:hypothetical protein